LTKLIADNFITHLMGTKTFNLGTHVISKINTQPILYARTI